MDTELFPWSVAHSNEELYEIKKESILNPESRFIAVLGNSMREYFETVRGMAYEATPDYEKLKGFLENIKISQSGSEGSGLVEIEDGGNGQDEHGKSETEESKG